LRGPVTGASIEVTLREASEIRGTLTLRLLLTPFRNTTLAKKGRAHEAGREVLDYGGSSRP